MVGAAIGAPLENATGASLSDEIENPVSVQAPTTGQKSFAGLSTEERILRNALRHFCDYGYTGTSVRDITAASDVTKPTLYYYFRNKEELYARLAKSCFETVETTMRRAVTEGASFPQVASAFLASYEGLFKENPDVIKFCFSIGVNPQKGAPEVGISEHLRVINRFVEQIVGNAVEKGECLVENQPGTQLLIQALFAHFRSSLVTNQLEICANLKTAIVHLCTVSQRAGALASLA